MAAPSCVDYIIGGVKIQFPCKAYSSQLAMMNSIVRGLNNGQNCLLESPTGSGKSLALLCSTLGWQQGQHFKLQHGGISQDEKSQTEKRGGDLKKSQTPCQCVCHSKTSKSSAAAAAAETPVVDLTVSPCKETKTQPAGSEDLQPKRQSIASRLSEKLQSTLQSEAERDDDFRPDRKRIRTADLKSRKKPRMDKGVIFLDDEPEFESHTSLNHRDTDEHNSPGTSHSPPGCVNEVCTKCPCDFGEEVTNKKPKIPKIFFGTRTHKQIKQITHELKRTLYSSVPMTILSSRDHSCVNADVAPHANRNERCKDLREAKEGYSCRYFHNVQKMRDQSTLQFVHGLHKAWDIEELVSLGKRIRACSYYAARELMQSANIVFCPYNYLLDPLIRESMEIDLSGQILVLDEAHNIEDCARECASYTLSLQSLHLCRDELESMISAKIRRAQHEPLRGFCYSLINWIQESQSLMSDRGYESASKVWGGREVVDIFRTLGITPDTFAMLEQNLASVMEKEERVIDDVVELPTISSASATVLKSIFMVLDFLYRGNSRFADDYRVALQKSYTWTNQAPPDVPDANGFIVRRQRQRSVRVKTEVLTLSFWCLNPAVAFSDLGDTVHSIVLTSGTLSPMGSFSSELGVKFTIQLEANHVINKSQVWVGTVGAGPQGRKLCATFQHTETYTFQDEVGELLLHICQAVSKGVLCFLSSYKMLDKLRDRWVNTGLWEKLETLKTVITEPRGGGKGDFDELLQVYYDAIKYSDQRDGALLMAVCRGKVSEGLDFTDDNARAVVTIGIPFPNNRDLQVELKMKYNDQHCKTRGLLSGHRWYEIQAYRALNQALGRCIRHKNDWGALVLVDERYRNNPNRYITGLSKWVRQLVHHHDTFPNAMQSLVAFSHQQRMRSEGGGSSESQTQSPSPSPSLGSPGSSMGMSLLKEPRTPLSVVDPVATQRSPPPAAVQNNIRIKVNGEADLKTERSLMAPVCNSKTEVYPIFASSPINPCFRKPIFKEKDSGNSSFKSEPAPFVDTNARQPAFTVEDNKKTDLAQATDAEILMQNGDVATESVKATTGEEEPQLLESSDEEDETVFFTPELFEGEEMEEDQGSPEQTSVQRQKDEKEGQSFRARAEEIGEEAAAAAAGGGGEEEEEVEVSQSRQAESKLRRLSRSRQKNNSATQGERVGRVRRPQIQTRSSQRRRETVRAETKEELNNKPNRRVSEDTRGRREKQNKMAVQLERCCKKSEPKTGMDDLEKDTMRENKENTTPKSSRCTVFDIVTPKQKETGRLEREDPESVKSQEAKLKVIKIQRSCKQKRRQRSSPKRKVKKAKDQSPCCLGLYCGSCGKELLRDAQGALKREACGSGQLSLLQKYKLKSSKMTHSCKCGSAQKSLSDNTEKLLVVRSNVFLKDLNKTLQPLCEEDTQTGYNAIWDPCAGSVTRFLQCKGCLSKSPPLSVEPIAAEVHFPRDTAQDQMWLSPASVWRCSQIHIHC